MFYEIHTANGSVLPGQWSAESAAAGFIGGLRIVQATRNPSVPVLDVEDYDKKLCGAALARIVNKVAKGLSEPGCQVRPETITARIEKDRSPAVLNGRKLALALAYRMLVLDRKAGESATELVRAVASYFNADKSTPCKYYSQILGSPLEAAYNALLQHLTPKNH